MCPHLCSVWSICSDTWRETSCKLRKKSVNNRSNDVSFTSHWSVCCRISASLPVLHLLCVASLLNLRFLRWHESIKRGFFLVWNCDIAGWKMTELLRKCVFNTPVIPFVFRVLQILHPLHFSPLFLQTFSWSFLSPPLSPSFSPFFIVFTFVSLSVWSPWL